MFLNSLRISDLNVLKMFSSIIVSTGGAVVIFSLQKSNKSINTLY